MDWNTIFTIGALIFFAVMMLRGGGCCGMAGHRHSRGAPKDEAAKHSQPKDREEEAR